MQEIENMCVMFQYATPGNIESIQSELLKHFSVNISTRPELHEQLDKCLQLLHYSKREIVHSIVQNHLRLLLCRKNSLFQSQDLVSLFQTLKQSPPTFTNSKTIFNSYLQILAIITALSWLDSKEIEDSFKKQLEDLENGRDYEIGLVAIYHVISEMNQQTSEIKGFNKHRRVSISFRDEQLLAVLKNGYRIFVEAAEASGSPTETVPGIILEYSVKILMACLNYDFLGYQQDQENHGMTSTIQIPSSWKDFILESFPMNILVKSFQVLPEILHNELLETIGYFLGCKRSLFSESERRTYFDKCLENLMVLLDYPFKNETFSELLKGILRFATVYSPEFKHSSQSSSFLSKFYAYNVSSMGVVTHIDYLCFVLIWVQLRDSEHSFFVDNLEDFQQLVRTLVTIEDQMLECLYTEEVTTLEQIQQPLGKLIRKTLSVSSKLVVERLQRWGMGTTPKDYIETAWTIFLYSGALSHRIAYQASDEDDTNDGIVAGNIFRFIMYKQFQSINEICEETLEIAILSFFEQFKYSFLSSEANSCVRMWESLNNFSVESPEKVLLISLNRILYFLNHSSDENLVCKAADVFHEYVTGVYSCKMLQKTEIMDFIEESGVFQINIQCSYSKSKVIMKVFESIGRLFFTHQYNERPEEKLDKLLKPSCEYLQEFQLTGQHHGKMDFCIRRLRGILAAVYTNKLFKHYFMVISPYLRAISLYISSPGTSNGPFNGLRLVKELSNNKVNRLNFEANAEYGILLFRETIAFCETEVAVLEPLVVSTTLSDKEWLQLCMKPIYIILSTFTGLITSKAVPFGILQLYNEPSLQEMIKMAYFLSNAIHYSHISQYSKIANAYFSFWTAMTGDSMMYLLTSITPAIFNSLMTNCFQAIQMLDDSNASQACSIVNKIFSDSIEHNGKFFNIDGNVHHEKFLQLITTRIFTESLESQWSFTRPMLPLILYQGDWFVQYMNILIQGNEKLQEVMNGLLEGIDSTLSIKNRDTLTRNIDACKRALECNGLRLAFPDERI